MTTPYTNVATYGRITKNGAVELENKVWISKELDIDGTTLGFFIVVADGIHRTQCKVTKEMLKSWVSYVEQ